MIALGACSAPPVAEEPEAAPSLGSVSRARVRQLREREAAVRSGFSPATAPAWIDVSGADPYRIVSLADGSGFVGALRGSKSLVRLDRELAERARLELPVSPTALCVAGETAWVASRYDTRLLRVSLAPDGSMAITRSIGLGAAGVADLACGEQGLVYVLPADGSELVTLDAQGHRRGGFPALAGGLRLRRYGRYLLELSLFERSLRVLALDEQGRIAAERARIHHDGTLWGFDALPHGSELLLAVTGVEDKPLVRAHGEFENIDSFAWVYRIDPDRTPARELARLDVGDSGLVVPKAVALRQDGAELSLSVLAAGSGRLLRATLAGDAAGDASLVPAALETSAAPPGAADAVFSADGRNVVYASPLLDAFIASDASGVRLRYVDAARRPPPEVRLGEALFFTELMAPENTSQGTHSRFSCETCHFEGGLDGRTHYTGRADVSVVTKPLFGLANNRPHFSRAMDPDLSSVCHNEFRVAGAGSGTDPWFALETARFPWLRELGIERAELAPLGLRDALLQFLYAFTHAPNPRSQGRAHFSSLERRGAQAFLDHCASCHAPRLSTDAADSAVPLEDWEALVLSRSAPLVWARPEYARVGVLPYVHERGTRITSLRRLALKPRYFTNGSAPDLQSVLARFRETPDGALHEAPPGVTANALPPSSQQSLLAFLQLL